MHFILPSRRRMQTNANVSECRSNTTCRVYRPNGNAFRSFLFLALPICSSKRYTLFPRSEDQNYADSALNTVPSLPSWREIIREPLWLRQKLRRSTNNLSEKLDSRCRSMRHTVAMSTVCKLHGNSGIFQNHRRIQRMWIKWIRFDKSS